MAASLNEKRSSDDHVEEILAKDQAIAATNLEHRESVWQILRKEPKVAFWCLFFAFSAIGW